MWQHIPNIREGLDLGPLQASGSSVCVVTVLGYVEERRSGASRQLSTIRNNYTTGDALPLAHVRTPWKSSFLVVVTVVRK